MLSPCGLNTSPAPVVSEGFELVWKVESVVGVEGKVNVDEVGFSVQLRYGISEVSNHDVW